MLGCETAYVYLTTGNSSSATKFWRAYYQDSQLDTKPFIEGLIQLAAAFRMFVDFGEVKGPVRAIYQALIRFENYQPAYLQVRVKDLSTEVEAWAKAAEAAGAVPSTADIPKIQLQRFNLFS